MTIGDRRRLRVAHVGNADVVFHGFMHERLALVVASYALGLGFN